MVEIPKGRDEVYIVCGHKGQPEKVKLAKRKGRKRRLKGKRGRGTLKNGNPPVLGMIQRNGNLILRLLSNVQQNTIEPIIKEYIEKGTLIYIPKFREIQYLYSFEGMGI